MRNINIFVKPYINHIKKVGYTILILIVIGIFSVSSLMAFTLTCRKHFCYYNKCYKCCKHNFDKKIKCFFEKTNDFGNWILLDLASVGIILGTFLILILLKKTFIKMKKYFTDCKNKYQLRILSNNHYNKKIIYTSINFNESLEKIEELEELEELEVNEYKEELDPLLMTA